MSLNDTIMNIARVCHEANRAYCLAIGDPVKPAWEVAPDWMRNSAMIGVVFHLQNPDATPDAGHNAWMAKRLADGWKYGAYDDAIKRTHPGLVPFESLPLAQQRKDVMFRALVHALAHGG